MTRQLSQTLLFVFVCMGGAAVLMLQPAALGQLPEGTTPSVLFWLATLVLGALAVQSVRMMATREGGRLVGMATAALFGLWIVYFWQLLVVAFDVPKVLLPPPALIVQSIGTHSAVLWGDFVQTVLKAVLIGWALGSGLGFAVAVAIDRQPFLQRGLLPLASLTSTIPLVAVAPIAVMWFGFEWQSKAAVVMLMTFFPMLVSTLAGLKASGKLERELMYSYAASYTRTLLALRLPSALPFIFGALKVNATLALIGAIVAEFFGSPTAGLGFRISTEASRMNMPLVWSAIVVAAITGSVAYAVLVQFERRAAFWHPSVRGN
jgi:NitT/TauT family transport system permease protein